MTEPVAEPATAAPSRPRRRWSWKTKTIIVTVILAPFLIFALFVIGSYNWSYSSGERAGFVQKFSRKGWLCKTWEGELAMATIPGSVPEKFLFTVRDDAVADHLNRTMASG